MKKTKIKIPKIKIETNLAIGIIVVISLVFAGFFYWQSRQEFTVANLSKIKKNALKNAPKLDSDRILFATNGTRDVYKIKKDDKWVVVDNGQESQVYDYVATPTFSLDGIQFAYSAGLNGQTVVVLNDTIVETDYTSILDMLFSADGQKLAYVGSTGNGYVVVVNNQAGKTYQQIGTLETSNGTAYIIFSSDGEKVAYKAVEGEQVFIVVNGEEGQKYVDITEFLFSSDGSQFAYLAETANQEQITVVNQTEIPAGSQNNSGTGTNTNNGTNGSSGSSSGSSSGGSSRRGTKDVHLDENRLQYSPCTGSSCNF